MICWVWYFRDGGNGCWVLHSLFGTWKGNEGDGGKKEVDYNVCKLFKDRYNEKSPSLPILYNSIILLA